MQLIDKIYSVVPDGYKLDKITTKEPGFQGKGVRLVNGTITCWVPSSFVRTNSTTARSLYVESEFAVCLDWQGNILDNWCIFAPKFYWKEYLVQFDPTFKS